MPSVRDVSAAVVPFWVAPRPLSARERRLLICEIVVVFAVSLGISAVRSLVLLIGSLTAPKALSSQQVVMNASQAPGRPWLDLSLQLVLSALQDGILEEVLVVGYLLSRLRLLGVSAASAVAMSAVLRGSYHLHQGIGPFIGNMIMGVIFAVLFFRWRRTNPMIITHALINTVAFVGFTLLSGHVGWLP